MTKRPTVLSIAGFDPSSGAGITADIKTAAALGCFAVTCPTALTIQSTQGVFGLERVRRETVRETLWRLADDIEIAAVRIGMLGTGEVAMVVADFLRELPARNVVLDPVIRSSSGAELLGEGGVEAVRKALLPLSDVVTPNLNEALMLAGSSAGVSAATDPWESVLPTVRKTARMLNEMGAKCVVLTGGDLAEPNDFVSLAENGEIVELVLPGRRIESLATHGTGCAFATAIACGLAHGKQTLTAVEDAKEFVRRAINAAYPVGKGRGPMNHLFRLD